MSKNKFIVMMLILCSIILTTLAIGIYQNKNEKQREESISKKLITIQIDGEDYLYGHFGRTTILIPKAKSCKCSEKK